MTALQRLLTNIEPIPDRTAMRMAEALNDFDVPAVLLDNLDALEQCLARFYCHLECAILGTAGRPINREFDLTRCYRLLAKAYGTNTRAALFDIARTGAGGGLMGILQAAAREFGNRYAKDLISMSVESYFRVRPPTQLLADMNEYVHNYQDLLPSEMGENGAARIKGEFRAFLKEHPFVIRSLRQAVRGHAAGQNR